MRLPVYNSTGEVIREIELSEGIFAVPFNEAVVQQFLLGQLANRRQGTASTKGRGEVRGSGRKLFSQKHTGLARRGDIKSPLLRGGGVTFGPQPRSYRQETPKKMRRLALKCLLSAKVRDGEFKIIDKFPLDRPQTKAMKEILVSLGADDSVLIVTAESEPNVVKSAANVSGVRTLPAALLNVADMFSCRLLLTTEAAVAKVMEIWGIK